MTNLPSHTVPIAGPNGLPNADWYRWFRQGEGTIFGGPYQPLDADLTAIAALSTTSFGRSLLELANAAAGLTALGGQPLDSDLTAIAGLSPSNDDIIQRKAGAWTNRTMAQLATDLGYDIGTYTPTITASSGTFTTVSATGRYIRMKKMVFWSAVITVTTIGTAGNHMFVTLPFTAQGTRQPCAGINQNTGVSIVGDCGAFPNSGSAFFLRYDGAGFLANTVFNVGGMYEAAT